MHEWTKKEGSRELWTSEIRSRKKEKEGETEIRQNRNVYM